MYKFPLHATGVLLALTGCLCFCAVVPDQYPKTQHRFDLQRNGDVKDNAVPDLQVGCGDGGLLVESTSKSPKEITKQEKIKRDKREADPDGRKPRSYFAYTVYTPASLSYSAFFRPQPYRIPRPYYIPVFGSEGRLPIYFPPQPVYFNTAFPFDNPPLPPPKKDYLPARPDTPPATEATTDVSGIADRFGEPVWDSIPVRPLTTQATPTRRPNRPKTSTFPPLVHDLQATSPPRVAPPRPVAPPKQNEVEIDRPRPSTPRPNQCAFAIINCCSGSSKDVRNSCFERLGCPGPFWDRSPCESDFARRAVEYALKYYEEGN